MTVDGERELINGKVGAATVTGHPRTIGALFCVETMPVKFIDPVVNAVVGVIVNVTVALGSVLVIVPVE